MSLLNNTELDIKIKCLESNMTQNRLGSAIGSTGQYVNRLMKKKGAIVNKTYIAMLEKLGYDIRLEYVPRVDKVDEN